MNQRDGQHISEENVNKSVVLGLWPVTAVHSLLLQPWPYGANTWTVKGQDKAERAQHVLALHCVFLFYFIILKRFYLFTFLERGVGWERERKRNVNVWEIHGCLSHAPIWGHSQQHRHVLWLGIELTTFQFTGWCSIHWATLARAHCIFLKKDMYLDCLHVHIHIRVHIHIHIHIHIRSWPLNNAGLGMQSKICI